MFTGGAGGDFLVAGRVSVGKNSLKFSLSADAAAQNETNPTTAVDTLIYTAASDSRVDLDEMTGFDKIIEFDQGVDKIKAQLGAGSGLAGHHQDASQQRQHQVVEDDHRRRRRPVRVGLQSCPSRQTEAFRRAGHDHGGQGDFTHPQFLLRDSLSAISGNNITVTWVLVDYDGDGDFAASTDMAIALIQPDGTLTASDFI